LRPFPLQPQDTVSGRCNSKNVDSFLRRPRTAVEGPKHVAQGNSCPRAPARAERLVGPCRGLSCDPGAAGEMCCPLCARSRPACCGAARATTRHAHLSVPRLPVRQAGVIRSRLSSAGLAALPLRRTRGASIGQAQMKAATLDDATEWTLSMAIAKDGGSPVDLTVRVKFSEDEVRELGCASLA